MSSKFFSLTFFVIPRSRYNFLSYHHQIDSALYNQLSPEFDLKHIKFHDSGYSPSGLKQNEVYFKGRNRFFYFPYSLCLFVRKEAPEILFLHGFVFPFQTLFLRLFTPKNTKIIVQHHAEKPFLHPVKLWFQKMAYSNLHAYLFASKELAIPFINKKIIKNDSLVKVVMEGSSAFQKSDKSTARNKLNLSSTKIFLWVGRLNLNKDPMTVIKAFHNYKETDPNFRLYMIYGTSDLEGQIKEYLTNHKLNGNIIMIGKVPHPELQDWFNASDYFVSASHYEGSGIALAEAMSCGCIPIVTSIPSFKMMTGNGDCGILFEPGDFEGLSLVLRDLLKVDQAKMEERVLLKFKNELSLEAIGKKIKEIAVNLNKKD